MTVIVGNSTFKSFSMENNLSFCPEFTAHQLFWMPQEQRPSKWKDERPKNLKVGVLLEAGYSWADYSGWTWLGYTLFIANIIQDKNWFESYSDWSLVRIHVELVHTRKLRKARQRQYVFRSFLSLYQMTLVLKGTPDTNPCPLMTCKSYLWGSSDSPVKLSRCKEATLLQPFYHQVEPQTPSAAPSFKDKMLHSHLTGTFVSAHLQTDCGMVHWW